MTISKDDVVRRLSEIAFGKPLVSNIYRGLVAEVIVASELSAQWKHSSADWNGWDFEHEDGCKLEVKQSAVLQSWSTGKLSASRFSIAESEGFFIRDQWTASRDRKSSIYIFALHTQGNPSLADHRDPLQWSFYVLPSSALPAGKTASLSSLIKVAASALREMGDIDPFPCAITELRAAVDSLHDIAHRQPLSG